MSIWGKIIGGTAGFAVGGPLGALIGAVAGHAYDKYSGNKSLTDQRSRADDPWASRGPKQRGKGPSAGSARRDSAQTADLGADDEPLTDDATRKIAFTIAVIVLGAKIAKADGRVTRDEVAAFRQVFHVPPNETKNVARVFNQARRDSAGFEPYARQMGRMFRDRPAVLEELMRCLFHIAKADGAVADTEIAFLSRVATELGLDQVAFDRLKASELGDSFDDPYTILGVPANSAEQAVKTAYRKLVREHHPDRLVAQGLPDEFVEGANDQLARINAAYDQIKKVRGWT